jgi:hypothetical protein
MKIANLEVEVSQFGVSDSVGGAPCGAVWAVIWLYAIL